MTRHEHFGALARFFRTEEELWPRFSHILFQADEPPQLAGIINRLGPRSFRCWHSGITRSPYSARLGIHLFYLSGDMADESYLAEATLCYCCLNRQAWAIIHDELSGDPCALAQHCLDRPGWHWQWMDWVHWFAQSWTRDERLMAAERGEWLGERLPDGVQVSTLPCGVFLASALSIELGSEGNWDDLTRRNSFIDRNQFCFEQRLRGEKYGEIGRQANRRAGWPKLWNKQAVRAAIKAHCKRAGEAFPVRPDTRRQK